MPYQPPNQETGKRRFATKLLAEAAAEEQMLLKVDIVLYVYRGLDGGWYLTRKEK